ncbi:MAG: glycosyltransferase, partial [Magnetococcales bacterium]|nr:glycosyltransferase [Magnetococcales bacterium]
MNPNTSHTSTDVTHSGPTPKPDLTVIIPALNEPHTLEALLGDLGAQTGLRLDILVADGGSDTTTINILKKHDIRRIKSPPGRGRQMNRAAQKARGTMLLFLHADSRITRPDLLAEAMAQYRKVEAQRGFDRLAGHFPLRFATRQQPPHPAYRFYERKTTLNRPQVINGDQGMLISRRFFYELGMFDASLPFMEDQKMAAHIFERGEWITLPGHLHTSARRFEEEGLA